jgi:FlaA1/EpsC-like NDP-sugar epimerase
MRRAVLLILWLLSDMLIFVGAYTLSYFLRVGLIMSTDFPLHLFLQTVVIVAPICIAVMAQLGIFRLMRNQSSVRNIFHILFACAMGSALFTLFYYFLYSAFFSRLLLVYAFVLSTAFLVVWHIGFEQVMRKMLRAGRPLYPTLIVGATREAARLIQTLNDQRNPLTPVAILDGRGTKETEIHGVPVEGKLNKLEETLTKYHITHLIQCSDLEQSINLLSACRNRGISYILLPSVLGIVESNEAIESIEKFQVTMVRPKKVWWHWFFG